jgi:hypothetical protein
MAVKARRRLPRQGNSVVDVFCLSQHAVDGEALFVVPPGSLTHLLSQLTVAEQLHDTLTHGLLVIWRHDESRRAIEYAFGDTRYVIGNNW